MIRADKLEEGLLVEYNGKQFDYYYSNTSDTGYSVTLGVSPVIYLPSDYQVKLIDGEYSG